MMKNKNKMIGSYVDYDEDKIEIDQKKKFMRFRLLIMGL
jgi:hypothetical protein